MKPSSTTIFYLIILSATIIFNSCSSDSSRETSISWDRYGVPHIKAKSTDDLFFAQGWALMQNHANKVLELYGKSRGRASEYWGEQYLQNDILIHTLGFEELSQEWDLNQLPELKSMYNNFVKGINSAWAEKHNRAIGEYLAKYFKKDIDLIWSKANMFTRMEDNYTCGFHTDITDRNDLYTMVYYVNTNNGGTQIQNGPFIPSIKNTAVLMSCDTMHSTVTQTDTNVRLNINFNFKVV